MKKEFNVILVALLLIGCQEPVFREPSKVDETVSRIVVDPETKTDKSSRQGRFISNSYWNMYRGNSNGLWFNYSANGTNWSSSAQVNSGAELDQAPETLFFNDRLIAAYRGTSGAGQIEYQEVYITYSDDGINWYQIQTPVSTTSTPALVVKNGSLFVYGTQAAPPYNQGTVFQYNTSDLVSWNSSSISGIPGNQYNFGLTAALDGANRVHLFYHVPEGGNVRMKSTSSNDGINFGGPTQVVRDYGISSGVDNDVVRRGSTIAMAYRSGNVRVIPDIINAPSTSYAIANSSTSRGPSITLYGSRLVVTYKGNSSNNVWFSYSDNGGISWSGQTTHSGSTPSGPSITAIGAN